MSGYISVFDETYGANVFSRDINKNEYLTEIGISSLTNSAYDIYINPDNGNLDKDSLIKIMEVEELSAGYHTIELPDAIRLTGNKFAIVVKYLNSDEQGNTIFGIESKTYDNFWDNAENSTGESLLSNDLITWYDVNEVNLNNSNLTIKAFTIEQEKEELYVKIKSHKEIEKENKHYITYIEPGTTANALKNNISTNGNIEILSDDIVLKTGVKININFNKQKKEYIIIVTGDIDKDGDSDFWDMSKINKYRLGKINISTEENLAGDVNEDGKVDFWDMSRINKYRLNKINRILVQ